MNRCCTNLQLVDSETLEPILIGGLPVTKPNLAEDPDFIPCEPDSPDCTPETTTTPPIPAESICYMKTCFDGNPLLSQMDYMWTNCSDHIAGLQAIAPGVTINEWSTIVTHVVPAASLTAMGATIFAPAHYYAAAGIFNTGNCYYEEIWYQGGVEVGRTTTVNNPAGGVTYFCTSANARVSFNGGSPVTLDPTQDLTIEFRITNCGGSFFGCSDPENLPVSKAIQLRINLIGYDCPGDPPPPPLVNCCIDGDCQSGLEEDACLAAGGTVVSTCTECVTVPPVINSCCYWDGTNTVCVEGDHVTEDYCAQLLFEQPEPPGGVVTGWNSGLTCSESSCDVVLGYCCTESGCIENVTENHCYQYHFGTFWIDTVGASSCVEACGEPASPCLQDFSIQVSDEAYKWDALGNNEYCATDGFGPAQPGFIAGFSIPLQQAPNTPFHTATGVLITDPEGWHYGYPYRICGEVCEFDTTSGFHIGGNAYLYFAQVNVGTGLVGINVILYVTNGCITDYEISPAC